jgi:cellulose synthase (UDP-forming)
MKEQTANRHPITVQRLLLACGINSSRSWWELLFSWFFRLPEPDANGLFWQPRLACLFPHIDFQHLRPADLIRIPLQVLWLILHKPRSPNGDLHSLENARSGQLPAIHHKKEGHSLLLRWERQMQKVIQVLPFLARANKQTHNLRNRLTPNPDRMRTNLDVMAGHPVWDHALVRYGAYVISAILTLLCITTPFNTLTQAIFVALLWIIALLIRKIPGQVTTLLLIVLSVTASTRYIWWRINYTMNTDDYFDLMWSLLLLGADLYTWFFLLSGFLQTAWTLNRQPTTLPSDPGVWPTVDLYITTYNEPFKVVKPTIYAALDIDWPKDKLNIYLLDDGRREEFRLFAEKMGVGYITRPDNRDAKAGNLNHALTKTNGEFIAIFDCDHIPTRSFLQVSMGGFMKDSKLALVQTPHHFFSPDPFERNLGLFRRIPNEGELFYGLIQNGNDMWNATFFCGSCAILRRGPLEEIGGIAVETVTEDAHTSLKLHRSGYTSVNASAGPEA